MAISPEISTCLMTGIVTDTSFFTNKATSAIATAASSHLLNCGVNLKEVINNTWKNQSLESLKIWGEILSKLQFNPKYKIATSVIIPQSTVNYSVFEGLANFLTAIYEADIILVLIQMDEQTIKGSLRTTKDNVDVARLAKVWGGGGHAKAAGFSLKGKLVREDNCWKVR